MNHVLEALEEVMSWDLPDEVTADAVTTQACLLAGACADDIGANDLD